MCKQGVRVVTIRVGGIPAHGNQRSEWDADCRFDFENPEYRRPAACEYLERQRNDADQACELVNSRFSDDAG